MKHQPWPAQSGISGGTSNVIVPKEDLVAQEGELLMMAAFVQGFADQVVKDHESNKPSPLSSIDLRRID